MNSPNSTFLFHLLKCTLLLVYIFHVFPLINDYFCIDASLNGDWFHKVNWYKTLGCLCKTKTNPPIIPQNPQHLAILLLELALLYGLCANSGPALFLFVLLNCGFVFLVYELTRAKLQQNEKRSQQQEVTSWQRELLVYILVLWKPWALYVASWLHLEMATRSQDATQNDQLIVRLFPKLRPNDSNI